MHYIRTCHYSPVSVFPLVLCSLCLSPRVALVRLKTLHKIDKTLFKERKFPQKFGNVVEPDEQFKEEHPVFFMRPHFFFFGIHMAYVDILKVIPSALK